MDSCYFFCRLVWEQARASFNRSTPDASVFDLKSIQQAAVKHLFLLYQGSSSNLSGVCQSMPVMVCKKALHSYWAAETLKRVSCKATETADITQSAPEASFTQDSNTLISVTTCQVHCINYSFFFSPLHKLVLKSSIWTQQQRMFLHLQSTLKSINDIKSAYFLHKYFLWKRDLSLSTTLD